MSPSGRGVLSRIAARPPVRPKIATFAFLVEFTEADLRETHRLAEGTHMAKPKDKSINIGFATSFPLPANQGQPRTVASKPESSLRTPQALSYSGAGLSEQQMKALWAAIPDALNGKIGDRE